MEHYSFTNVIIGFGKGGKTLAKFLAGRGEEVLVIERSDQMYGGTCINVGCLPSKNLILNGQKGLPFDQATVKRERMTEQLRAKNYHMVADEETATVMNGTASFLDDHTLAVKLANGKDLQVTGERIFINTGARPNIPTGVELGPRIVTSKEAMELPINPARLAIVGGGHIGLEFAGMFSSYGSRVTVFDHHQRLLMDQDEDVAALVTKDLIDLGITIVKTKPSSIVDDGSQVQVTYRNEAGESVSASFDAVLLATGRRPNTEGLGLENTGIAVTQRGAIAVDEHLRTSVDGVWALGDVNGGPQFTYISLDDFRIIRDQLAGEGKRTTTDRFAVPSSTFLTPPLAHVGMTENQIRQSGLEAGKDYLVFSLPAAAVPKARVMENQRGIYKILVDKSSHEILGATIYANEAHEIINIIALAMKGHLAYELLRDMIYTHPTMAEALNDVLAKPAESK
ncbi:MAG: FAD-dependent oxidoreductase [Parascardovia denticolens]